MNTFLRDFQPNLVAERGKSVTSEEILSFLGHFTQGAKQSTKRLRFSLLQAFFSFIINRGNERFRNPCDSPIIRKIFKSYKPVPWKIVEKETVDEVTFSVQNSRPFTFDTALFANHKCRIGKFFP